jgi:DNA-binding response OmpR family regulator
MAPRSSTPHERSGEFPVRQSVLLVEDDAAVLSVVSQMLRSRGFTVYEAHNPHMALGMASRSDISVDLLLTDIVMPGMSGLNLARRVRELHQNVGCMFMSGFAGECFDDELLRDPSCYFLKKPFPLSELMHAVEIALERSHTK